MADTRAVLPCEAADRSLTRVCKAVCTPKGICPMKASPKETKAAIPPATADDMLGILSKRMAFTPGAQALMVMYKPIQATEMNRTVRTQVITRSAKIRPSDLPSVL